MTGASTRAAMTLVLLLAGALYLGRLGDAPINVTTDEARFALQAHALAETGGDTRGNHLPLFFLIADPLIANHTSVAWWQPQLFYLMAGSFSLLGLRIFRAPADRAGRAAQHLADLRGGPPGLFQCVVWRGGRGATGPHPSALHHGPPGD